MLEILWYVYSPFAALLVCSVKHDDDQVIFGYLKTDWGFLWSIMHRKNEIQNISI